MGNTLVEKLIARNLSASSVKAGDIVAVTADRLLFNDYVGLLVFAKLHELGVTEIKNPERVFVAIDHNIPAFNVDAADKYVKLHEEAERFGIGRISKTGFHGIGHQMMVENYVRPLEIAFGTDSHATMYSGVGAFSCGITTTDAVSVLTTGTLWIKVPETIRIHVKGKLAKYVTAKDLSLKIITLFPEDVFAYKAVEIVGEAIDSMSVDSRLVIANMIAETGAKCAVFEADAKAYEYTGADTGERLVSDPDLYMLMSFFRQMNWHRLYRFLIVQRMFIR